MTFRDTTRTFRAISPSSDESQVEYANMNRTYADATHVDATRRLTADH